MESYPTYTFKDGSHAEVEGQPIITQQFVPPTPTPPSAPTPNVGVPVDPWDGHTGEIFSNQLNGKDNIERYNRYRRNLMENLFNMQIQLQVASFRVVGPDYLSVKQTLERMGEVVAYYIQTHGWTTCKEDLVLDFHARYAGSDSTAGILNRLLSHIIALSDSASALQIFMNEHPEGFYNSDLEVMAKTVMDLKEIHTVLFRMSAA